MFNIKTNLFTKITIGLVIVTIIGFFMFLNSDWFITKTMSIKHDESKLGGCVVQFLDCKYEKGFLKTKYTLKNVDEDVVDFGLKNLDDTDDVIDIHFIDKDEYIVKSQKFYKNDFSSCGKNEYCMQAKTKISKSDLKQIAGYETRYLKFVTENKKKMQRNFENAMKGLFF